MYLITWHLWMDMASHNLKIKLCFSLPIRWLYFSRYERADYPLLFYENNVWKSINEKLVFGPGILMHWNKMVTVNSQDFLGKVQTSLLH